MAHANPAVMQQQLLLQQQQQHQKRRQFLHGLASVHMRSNPLPPELVGTPWPAGYDPAQSPWKGLDISRTELGHIRIAGKDVDLYRFWALVSQVGGIAKMDQQWPSLLRHFDLPDQHPDPQPSGQQSVAVTLNRLFLHILAPFDEAYKRNVREQQARAGMRMQPGVQQGMQGGAQGAGGVPDVMSGPSQLNQAQSIAGDTLNMNMPGMHQSMPNNPSQAFDSAAAGLGGQTSQPHTPQMPQHSPTNSIGGALGMAASSLLSQQMHGTPSAGSTSAQEPNGADADAEGRKRKMRQSEEFDPKRVRQRTGGSDSSDMRASVPPSGMNGQSAPAAAPRTIRQPSRRKIEYIPFSREVDTDGGRDLAALQKEYARAAHRPMKDMNEWGQVDVDAVTMSLRSRISTELSYGLTTTLRGSRGFPIAQAPDLLEEVLDILEDVGLEGDEDDTVLGAPVTPVKTYRELVNAVLEDGSRPFAGLERKHGLKDYNIGPRPRHGETILAVTNIIRNLSNFADNHEYLAKHDRVLTIMLRLCMLSASAADDLPSPASPALSLQDLLILRKDTLYLLVNIAGAVDLSVSGSTSKTPLLNARRAFELLSSFLSDPVESVSPLGCLLLSGVPATINPQSTPSPPSIADTALEVYTRLFQPDDNRHALSKAAPQEWLWTFLESLVHRLPVSNTDFQVVMRDVWLGYVEKILMAIFTIAFLAPPQLKKRIKMDRGLAFPKVLLRLVKRFTVLTPQEARVYFTICVRRAVEALKLIDDAEDSFDTSQSSSPTLMFGMGYGEHGESRIETGTGLLSGYQDEITWNLMLQREIFTDPIVFAELESLVRVDRLASVP
ncbi:predicted protein [Postia placenta Mad-698-R]|nr:predicted protein [Postia placenta Mad-698-R]